MGSVFNSCLSICNVKMSLCLTKYHAMKKYSGSGGANPLILSLSIRWIRVAIFMPRPRPLCTRSKSHDTHWVGGWVCPRAGLDAVAKKRNPCPCRESSPGRWARSLVTVLTGLPRSFGIHCVAVESHLFFEVLLCVAEYLVSSAVIC
jgi:hypothetical protein